MRSETVGPPWSGRVLELADDEECLDVLKLQDAAWVAALKELRRDTTEVIRNGGGALSAGRVLAYKFPASITSPASSCFT